METNDEKVNEELRATHWKKLIENAFKRLGDSDNPYERRCTTFSFGDNKDELKAAFIQCFEKYDKTIKKLVWMPEYDQVVDWMLDNEGRGLLLTGDCGRGKTTIILGVLRVIFEPIFRKQIHGFHAIRLTEKDYIGNWNYEKYWKWKFSYIDELGTESMVNDYGEKYEAFNQVINIAEQDLNILLISTNLDGPQLLARYGDRTTDRLKRLCKIIKFKGKSLRP